MGAGGGPTESSVIDAARAVQKKDGAKANAIMAYRTSLLIDPAPVESAVIELAVQIAKDDSKNAKHIGALLGSLVGLGRLMGVEAWSADTAIEGECDSIGEHVRSTLSAVIKASLDHGCSSRAAMGAPSLDMAINGDTTKTSETVATVPAA